MDKKTPSGDAALHYDPGVPTRGKLPFDAKTVGENIERARVDLGLSIEDLWEKIGLSSRTHWYAKVSGDRPFRWEEAAKFCAETHAPKGFPVLTWNEARAFERWLEGESENTPESRDPGRK